MHELVRALSGAGTLTPQRLASSSFGRRPDPLFVPRCRRSRIIDFKVRSADCRGGIDSVAAGRGSRFSGFVQPESVVIPARRGTIGTSTI